MVKIILLEPAVPGNIGAVARAMANFGFDKLVLVDPQCDHLDEEARIRSKHAVGILEKAEVVRKSVLENGTFDYLVGTTARLGADSNLMRTPVSPGDLAVRLKEVEGSSVNIGLLFGREGDGLHNEELELCDFVTTIPTDPDYPTLNLSHSVALILYELSRVNDNDDITSHIDPIGTREKIQILKLLDQVLDRYEFVTESKKETQRKLWKNILGRSFLSKRESYGLLGFLRRMINGQKKD